MSGRERKPYWNAYVGGVVLGVVLFASFFLTGQGLGASGGSHSSARIHVSWPLGVAATSARD